jgi:hypothetical protein
VGFAYLRCTDKIICRERTGKFASIFSGETMEILSVLDDIYQRKEREFNIFFRCQKCSDSTEFFIQFKK